MTTRKEDKPGQHPIGVAARRSGLKPDLIRAWERRYGAVIPTRSATGRRLYSEQDIERLILLRRLIAAGWRISDVADKRLPQLRELNRRELAARSENAPLQEHEPSASAYRDRALDAVLNLDAKHLDSILKEAMFTQSPIDFREKTLVPLLTAIGALWRSGEIRVVHEHLASAIIRTFFDSMNHRSPGTGRPGILIATPSGQLHEFGALMAAAAVDEIGWRAEYFGPNLPAGEIAAGAAALDIRAIAVSAIVTNDDAALMAELREIRRLVAPDIVLLIGGKAVAGLSPMLSEIGWVYLANYKELQEYLEQLLSKPGHV